MPQFALLLTTFVWGETFPATKAELEQIYPLSFLFLRFLLGMTVVFAVLLFFRRPLIRDTSMLRASLIATAWLFIGYVLQTVGLRFTTASNSAFITVLYVVFVPLYLLRLGLHTWVSNGIALAASQILTAGVGRAAARKAYFAGARCGVCRPYGMPGTIYPRGGSGFVVRVAIGTDDRGHVGSHVVGTADARDV